MGRESNAVRCYRLASVRYLSLTSLADWDLVAVKGAVNYDVTVRINSDPSGVGTVNVRLSMNTPSAKSPPRKL